MPIRYQSIWVLSAKKCILFVFFSDYCHLRPKCSLISGNPDRQNLYLTRLFMSRSPKRAIEGREPDLTRFDRIVYLFPGIVIDL